MLIELKGVKKDYPLGRTVVHAIRGVDLEISEGDFTVIAGPSGSGKTTLLNLMGLLDHPTEGKLFFEGRDVSRISDRDATFIRRSRIGFIFQTFNLIPVLTAIENVELPLLLKRMKGKERRKRAEEALAAVGLGDKLYHKPDELSGGERQRVAIARAIAGMPDIILADEPTANLDSETGLSIIKLMKEMNREQGVTFVFSTHDARIIEIARRKIELLDGKVVSDVVQNSNS
ncbi:MAG TPA: ABC transporter ATP-binding protein [candidate division WOR-3 bacterium]|uniref:ABC transporter ATP-binding protein n=1 Tax=candidate division WOR-3 bacterium TaxID=2052148 RepID=A0A7C0VAW9_UNCW3|nr:ABC transporter ATP-binding protein [candidate division WOR-3 bacterium]